MHDNVKMSVNSDHFEMVSVPQSFAALNHVSKTRSSFQIEIKELDGDELCASEMSWIELR